LTGFAAIVGLGLVTIASGIAKIVKEVEEGVQIIMSRGICLKTPKCS
jgi:hypothetical protein